jgi:hypothetical protein
MIMSVRDATYSKLTFHRPLDSSFLTSHVLLVEQKQEIDLLLLYNKHAFLS